MYDSTSQQPVHPSGPDTLPSPLKIVNGDVRTRAEKQERWTKEGKDVMVIEIEIVMMMKMMKSEPLRLIGSAAAS